MKSVFNANSQSIISDDNNGGGGLVGFYWLARATGTNNLRLQYANGASVIFASFIDFFQNLDNQWIHIVTVCDYTNKTIKAYKNGVQFGATQNLTGTPLFPSTNRVKYIGSYNTAVYKLTDGSLDDVKIYNRGLSASEIAQIYNQTKSKYGL